MILAPTQDLQMLVLLRLQLLQLQMGEAALRTLHSQILQRSLPRLPSPQLLHNPAMTIHPTMMRQPSQNVR